MKTGLIAVAIIALLTVGLFIFNMAGSRNDRATSTLSTSPENGDVIGDETTTRDDSDGLESAGDNSDLTRVTINANEFSFSPKLIEASAGSSLEITIVNAGGVHDFVIDELGVKTDLIGSGDSETVILTLPDTPGDFEFYCSVSNHREMGMVGTLRVK